MADKIVSWGGFDSKGTSGMGVTGSLGVSGVITANSFVATETAGSGLYFGAGSSVRSAGRFYLDAAQQITIRPGLGTDTNPFVTVTQKLYVGADTNGVPSSTIHVVGQGATSSTTSLLVQNANASNMLSLTDNGALTINTFQTSSTAFTVNRTNASMGGGNFNLATLGTLISINDTVGNSNGSKTTLYINSSGASGNNALIVENGAVGFGTTSPGSGFNSAYFTTLAGLRVNLASDYQITSRDYTSRINTSSGGGISFWGDASGQGEGQSAFAGIRGLKANNTYVNPLGNLAFYVQTGSSSHVITETTFREVGRFNELGYFGIGIPTPSASLHISGALSSVLLQLSSPTSSNILYVTGSGNVLIGTDTPVASTIAPLYIYKGPSNGTVGRAGITLHSGVSGNNGSYLHLYNYVSHWASGIQHYSAGGGGIQKMRFYIGYDASQQLGDAGNVMTVSSNGLGINTLAAEITANLQIKGYGTTSSTTSFLVQNANASASLSVTDDNRTILSNVTAYDNDSTNGALVLTNPLTGGSVALGVTSDSALRIKTNSYGLAIISNSTSAQMWIAGDRLYAFNTASGLRLSNYFNNDFTSTLNNNSVYINDTIIVSSSLHSYNALRILNAVSSSVNGVARGLYISPSLSGSVDYRAIETTVGNVIINSGSVGIGTSTPSASLHISGASSNVLLEIDSPAANNILYVSGSGNVGIGKSNPTYKLDVNGTINTGIGYGNFTTYSPDNQFGAAYVGEEVKAAIVTARSNPATYAGVTIPGASSALVLGTSYGYDVGFGNYIISVGDLNVRVNNTTQALYANTSGQIGVGFSGSLSARLHVKGSGTTTSTKTFLLQNSNGTQLGYVDDSGRWQIGQGTNSGYALEVSGSARISSTSGGYKLILKTTGEGNGAGLLVDQLGYTMLDVNASDVYMKTFPGNTSKLDFWNYNNYGGPTNTFFIQNSQYHVSLNSPDNYKIPIVKFPDATVPIIMGNIATSAIRGYLTVGGAFYASASLGASQRIVSTVSAIANNDTLIGLDIQPTFANGAYTGVTNHALRVSGSTYLYKSGSTVLDVQGSSGQLFSVTDSLSGSLFSVNTVAGLPVIEAFSDNSVNIGKYGNYNVAISGSTTTITGSLVVNGSNVTTAWTSYTPSWTSDGTAPTLGNGSLTGAYKVIGKTCFVRVRLYWGSTTVNGTGVYYFSLPVSASVSWGVQMPASILDNGNAWYQATANGEYGGYTDRVALIGQSSGANSSQGVAYNFPIAFGNLDSIQFAGSYEIA